MNTEKSVRTTVEIPATLYKALRIRAATLGVTLGDVYTEVMLAGAYQLKIQAKDSGPCIKQRKT